MWTTLLLLAALPFIAANDEGQGEAEMVRIGHARRNYTTLTVLPNSDNTSSAQFIVADLEQRKSVSSAQILQKFRPEPLPHSALVTNTHSTQPHRAQIITRNSSKPLPPPVTVGNNIDNNIFDKNHFEIINEYLEFRISNLTVLLHNANTKNEMLNLELKKLRRLNEEILHSNKILEAENVLLEKTVTNNGSYVKIVANQPLKSVQCFEIENKYKTCEANKSVLEKQLKRFIEISKGFDDNKNTTEIVTEAPKIQTTINPNLHANLTIELKKCIINVDQCYSESSGLLKLVKDCESNSAKNINKLKEAERLSFQFEKDNKYLTQQVVILTRNYTNLRNDSTFFFSKIFDYAVNIQEEGKFNESLNILYMILGAREKILGIEDPETISTQHEIAFVLNNNQIAKYVEAHKMFLNVLEKRRRIFGDDHQDTLLTMYNIADVLRNLRKNADVNKAYLNMLDSNKERIPHPQIVYSQKSFVQLPTDLRPQKKD